MSFHAILVALSLNVVVLNQLYLLYKKKEELNATVAFLVCLLVTVLPSAQDFHGLLGLITGALVIVYLGSFVYSRLAPKRRSVK
ncbi:hypothetical protein [Streptococcus suis]|uniref:hypothetical protein n=1 Tax=Streptococcus suis TaxID=1307 RepID=UPI0038BCF53E